MEMECAVMFRSLSWQWPWKPSNTTLESLSVAKALSCKVIKYISSLENTSEVAKGE